MRKRDDSHVARSVLVRSWRPGGAPAFAIAISIGALGGCSDEARVPVFPVAGKVQVEGEAPTGALVVFHPTESSKADKEVPRPRAKVKSDGSFQLTTYQDGDGAPAGSYAVTVEWYPLIQKDGDTKAGPNVVASEYSNPAKTPLTAVVKQSATELEPIAVKKATGVKAPTLGQTRESQ